MAGESGVTLITSQGEGVRTTYMSTPFYPIFKTEGEGDDATLTVQFNRGYIFDYSNSKTLLTPIPVYSKPLPVRDAEQSFYVQIKMEKGTGKVVEGEDNIKVIDGTDVKNNPDANAYEKLPLTSKYHLDGGKPLGGVNPDNINGTFIWYLKLAEFNKKQITNLYLRDNIHLNLIKIRQLGDPSSDETYPIVGYQEDSYDPKSPTTYKMGNGILHFSAVGKMSDKDLRVGGNNLVQVKYKNGVIRIGVSTEDVYEKLKTELQTLVKNAIDDHLEGHPE